MAVRYLERSRKRTGGLTCLRCQARFSGRDAYDRHLLRYATEDWCHLPEEVGLVGGHSGWWRLPAGRLTLDKAIASNGGIPAFPKRVQAA